MKESEFIAAQKQAEEKLEPVLRFLHNSLIEVYMQGFVAGLGVSEERLDNDSLVRLKQDAILQRRLKPEDFSVRLWNVLKAYDIKTLGDIIKHTKLDFLRMRNLGKTSLFELMDFVKQFGYEIRNEVG